jgi:hypothetical protein
VAVTASQLTFGAAPRVPDGGSLHGRRQVVPRNSSSPKVRRLHGRSRRGCLPRHGARRVGGPDVGKRAAP